MSTNDDASAESIFQKAQSSLAKLDSVSIPEKLRLYGLFKQATNGDNETSRPGMMNVAGRAKWDEYIKHVGKTKAEAKLEYAAYVKELLGDEEEVDASSAAAASYDTLSLKLQDKVLTITLNAPKRFNAFSWAMYDELVTALDAAAQDPSVNAVVLTGAGPYYSSGNDLANFTLDKAPEQLAADASVVLERFVNSFITFPKALIAAVNGPAIGIAMTTLALCDIVYASHKATFNTPFAALGQSPEGCSSYLFPQIMGTSRANEVLMGGRKLSAFDAKECGFVAEVFEASSFTKEVAARAKDLAQYNQVHIKAITRTPQVIDWLQQVNKAECELLVERWTSPECMAAIAKFMSRK